MDILLAAGIVLGLLGAAALFSLGIAWAATKACDMWDERHGEKLGDE